MQAFDDIETKLGRAVDVVINNAGIAQPKLALEVSESDWDKVMDTNLKGAFFVSQEAARRMVSQLLRLEKEGVCFEQLVNRRPYGHRLKLKHKGVL